MAFDTIWSVDIGKSSLKAVKLRRDRNNVEIVAVDKVDYPISKNGVDASAAARDALGVFRQRNNVKEPIAVVHPGQGTFSRFIKVPAFDEKRVNEMIGYEASQQIPFPLDEVTWDFHVIDREYLPGEEREVALFAVRREAIDDFLVDFQNEDLSVEMISIGYLGIFNFILHDIRPEEPSIVLDIGAAHTDLVLVDGNSFWIRPIPHSGGDVTRAIMDRFRLTYPEAEKLKLESSRAPKQAVKIFQAVIQPKLKELVGEVHRSIGFYRSQSGEVNFKHLYLLGNGSKIIGIKRFLEEQLGMEVYPVKSIQRFRVNREVNLKLLQTQLPSYATTLGCGLQALGSSVCDVDLIPREDKIRKEIGRKKRHAFIAAAIVLVAMLLVRFLINNRHNTIAPVVEDGTALTGEIKDFKIKIGELDQNVEDDPLGGRLDIDAKMDELKKTAELRPLFLKGLQAIETVVDKNFTNDAQEEAKLSKDLEHQAKITTLKQNYLTTGLNNKLWIPSIHVQRVFHSGEAEENPDRPSVKGMVLVQAYKFEVYVVIKARATGAKSDKFIRDKFAGPLEAELKRLLGQLERDPSQSKPESPWFPGIEVATGDPDLNAVLRIEDSRNSGLAQLVQEGGPFFGVNISWYMLPRRPVQPGAEPTPES